MIALLRWFIALALWGASWSAMAVHNGYELFAQTKSFRFYATELRGTPAMEPRWKRAAQIVNGEIGEALGQLYVAQFYPLAAKTRMMEMIANISSVMHDRLQKIDWMTEPTRQKALAKFARFYAKIGHPDKWKDYSTVTVRRDALFDNVRSATLFEEKRDLAKLGQPVDHTEWHMTPSTVNAYFDPTANNINFPAGILQPPFFDFTLDDAVNYGGIGAVALEQSGRDIDPINSIVLRQIDWPLTQDIPSSAYHAPIFRFRPHCAEKLPQVGPIFRHRMPAPFFLQPHIAQNVVPFNRIRIPFRNDCLKAYA